MDLAPSVVHPDPDVLEVFREPAVTGPCDMLSDGVGVYLLPVEQEVDPEGPVALPGDAEGERPVRVPSEGKRPLSRVRGAVGEAEPVVVAVQDERIRVLVILGEVLNGHVDGGELLVENGRVKGELPVAVDKAAVDPEAVARLPVRDDEALSGELLVLPPGMDRDGHESFRDRPLVAVWVVLDVYPLGEEQRRVPDRRLQHHQGQGDEQPGSLREVVQHDARSKR